MEGSADDVIVDTKKLRELAAAATPGPWTVDPYEHDQNGRQVYFPRLRFFGSPEPGDNGRGSVCINECRGPIAVHNATAEFIAAANPTAVIALLDQLAAMTAARDEMYLFAKIEHDEYGWGAECEWRAIEALRKVGAT